MDLRKSLGFYPEGQPSAHDKVIQYINLKLAALGYPIYGNTTDSQFFDISEPLLRTAQERNRLLRNYYCPADKRIQDFLDEYFKGIPEKTKPVKLPTNTFILDRHGIARTISVPPNEDSFISEIVESYRVKQGVLHNPKHDRRTTKGVFHIAEGGLPIPNDKKAVPKEVFRNILAEAFNAPDEHKVLPFTSAQKDKAHLFVSLLLRPTVCPSVPGFLPQKSSEIRFFAPGSLVSNLDFVESIFGNAGDPFLPENDAGLDVMHWTGHTGCVILAPHLIRLKKKDLGLPHIDKATDRQKRDGMCWKDKNELYNEGGAFKITCRNEQGVMVTVIADNYFGYCKKEVKTQISYSANLFGFSEEEHAGGAIAFPSYDLGDEFRLDDKLARNNATFKDLSRLNKDTLELKPEGYAIDKKYPSIIYVPEDSKFNLTNQSITWRKGINHAQIKLLAYHTYILPSGYKIYMEKQKGTDSWRLIGTVAQGTLCHKPCTVSGGGKSEISKAIDYAMIQGPVFVSDFRKDLDEVEKILKKDFGARFEKPFSNPRASRPILSSERSLGSVIKLLTPSSEFSQDYNDWLESLPHHIKDLIFVVKRHYKPEWKGNWREHFTVDRINGHLGHELKYQERKLRANYLRVGLEQDGSWRIYKLRQDFQAADKVQVEDDITASVVVPAKYMSYQNPAAPKESVKFVTNCEYRLFQRPDDAIHRGFDAQAEDDLSRPNSFLSNYEPLTLKDARELIEDAIGFDKYTKPVKKLIHNFVQDQKKSSYFVSSSHPRLIDGKPSKNPRYLQNRLDLVNHRDKYLAELGTRLFWKVPSEKTITFPVNAVLPGRRMNPPDRKLGIPALAVYNPVHYQELPELFMDFIASVTGKSPSTTGFGSEGALTKGPFNALSTTTDLNNALVDYILTGYQGFSSAAGYVGPKIRVHHDVSLLIPEIWCRMRTEERTPKFLIENGYLEKLNDFDYKDKKIPAGILGYRITLKFVHSFLGRIFSNPHLVFSEEMLKPEIQDRDLFAEGIENLMATYQRAAENYFKDGSIQGACPPLKALLHIMAYGSYERKDLNSPQVRQMFTREALLESHWYQDRLAVQQQRQIELWKRHVKYLDRFVSSEAYADAFEKMALEDRLKEARQILQRVESKNFIDSLRGTIGADPILRSDAETLSKEPRTAVRTHS